MQEFKDVQGRWDKLKAKISKDVKLLEEIMPKLRIFEVKWKDFFFFACITQLLYRPFFLCVPAGVQMKLIEKWNFDGPLVWQRLKAYIVYL